MYNKNYIKTLIGTCWYQKVQTKDTYIRVLKYDTRKHKFVMQTVIDGKDWFGLTINYVDDIYPKKSITHMKWFKMFEKVNKAITKHVYFSPS